MPGSMAKSAKTAVDLFPSLSGIPIVRGWVGIEAFSQDEMQIIGNVHGINGLIIASGFSGHGFGIGPAVGALIAEQIVTGKTPEFELQSKQTGELSSYTLKGLTRVSGTRMIVRRAIPIGVGKQHVASS